MKKHLIVIVGPTAIGKTNLSIQLAKHFSSEIVSADSRQFFKETSIGTAVPSAEEIIAAPHHFIQHISIHNNYSVGDYEKDALQCLDSLFKEHDISILIGGSGLYVDAVTKGLDTFPETDLSVRKQIQNDLDIHGLSYIQDKLKEFDPIYHQKVDLNNTHRVMRALEVSISSGLPYSSFLTQPKKERPFNIIKIGLSAERQTIYDRINQRVDIMMKDGLLEEVSNLYKHRDLNALNTVGYKELFKYLDGEWELDFAVSEIKKNTRRFAKRQLTWFRKDTEIQWFDYTYDIDTIVNHIQHQLS